ncbi:MAG: hypothetical protein AAB573_00610 [Patescibacteria group bacterium]
MGKEKDGSFERPMPWPWMIRHVTVGDHVRKNGEMYKVVNIFDDPENPTRAELVSIQQVDWRTKELMSEGMAETDRRRK